MFPTSYRSRAGTWTSRGLASIWRRRRRASSSNCSSLVFIHLMRTEVSRTIFAAMAGVSVVANDVGRIPLANPLLFEFSQWSKGLFPRSPLCGLICQIRVQGFTNNRTPRAAPFFRHLIHFFQQSIGYGDHHLGHVAPLSINISVVCKRSNLHFSPQGTENAV
jgi:hypothetical protein